MLVTLRHALACFCQGPVVLLMVAMELVPLSAKTIAALLAACQGNPMIGGCALERSHLMLQLSALLGVAVELLLQPFQFGLPLGKLKPITLEVGGGGSLFLLGGR